MNDREPYTSVWICPFCGADIASAPLFDADAFRVERMLASHLRERHPIRWRLSGKFRRAMRMSEAARA